jgi:hypothetical protein
MRMNRGCRVEGKLRQRWRRAGREGDGKKGEGECGRGGAGGRWKGEGTNIGESKSAWAP